MEKIYAKVEHTEYIKLLERVDMLEKENARLKAELKKATAIFKAEKKETKKGGNK